MRTDLGTRVRAKDTQCLPVHFEIASLAVEISVHVESPLLRQRLENRFGQYLVPTPPANATEVSFVSRGHEGWDVSAGQASGKLFLNVDWPNVEDFVRLLIVSKRPDLCFVHSSSIACGQQGAVFIGGSTSGKSTLASALAKTGSPLLADDLTPFDLASGTIRAFCQSPCLRPQSQELLGQRLFKANTRVDKLRPRWLFFLNAGPTDVLAGTCEIFPRQEREDSLKEWDRMIGICYGQEGLKAKQASSELTLRSPAFFERQPSLSTISKAQAARLMINHMLRPASNLDCLLHDLARLMNQVDTYALDAGNLAQTIALIQKVIG